jgi:hypothetical protein
MPTKTVLEFRALYGPFALYTFLAVLLGFQLPYSGAHPPQQEDIEFLTANTQSVREVRGATDELGDHWLTFLSQSTATNPENAQLELLWRNAEGVQTQVTLASGPALGPATLADAPGGGVYVVWEARRNSLSGSDRVLRGRSAQKSAAEDGSAQLKLGAVEEIPTDSTNPLLPHVARLAHGSIGLVWQARKDAFYQAHFAERTQDGNWSNPRLVSAPSAGDVWRPRIAASSDGRVLVAYDHFDPGGQLGFDVWLAIAANAEAPFQQNLVAGGPTYQGWPELEVDSLGRAWIAYEEAQSFGQGGPLRSFRRTNLAMVDQQGVVSHAVLPQAMQSEVRGDFPQLHVTATGLSLTRRIPREDYEPRNPNMRAFYATWSTSRISFDKNGRAIEEQLSQTDGGNENDGVVLSGASGSEFFYATDARAQSFTQRFAFDSPLENHWRLAHTRLEPSAGFPKVAAGPTPTLKQQWGRGPRAVTPPAERPTVLYGDLHRHTDLSRCAGRKDGTLLDAVRYALGPGKLSFMAITDHFQHLTPWSFWRQMRDIERWNAPGRLALLPGVERMVTDLGHQNLVFGSLEDARAAGRNRLPEDLTVGSVVAIPHMTSLPRNPFDWQRWNADVQRLVEVHQGRRGSFEGLPVPSENQQSPPANSTSAAKPSGNQTWPHAAFPAQAKVGWLTRLPAAIEKHETPPGVISSSDHASSGTGFAGIMWRGPSAPLISRASVFQALLERRTFATTGPNLQLTQPHYVEIQVESDAQGERHLLVQANAEQLGSITIFENGQILAVEGNPTSAPAFGKLLVRTHFGRGFAWDFSIDPLGIALSEVTVRQARPDLFAAPKVAKDGSLTVHYPANVSYAADVDLVFQATASADGQRVLEFEYISSVAGETPHKARFDLGKQNGSVAQRFWLNKRGKTPYFEVFSLGAGILSDSSGASEYKLRVPISERPEGAIYYARVSWLDGNYAWSRLIR